MLGILALGVQVVSALLTAVSPIFYRTADNIAAASTMFALGRASVRRRSAPSRSTDTRSGDAVSAAYRRWLEAEGLDPDPANIWGHGAVGYIWAVADRWILTDLRRPRAEVVAYVNQFFVPAFAAQTRKSA